MSKRALTFIALTDIRNVKQKCLKELWHLLHWQILGK